MIDHVAHPSFDAAATHRFYTDVLGARLKSAFSGESSTWNARFLLAAYELEGAEVDFFSYAGIVRPPSDGLPRDIRHVGVTVASPTDVTRLRQCVEANAVEHWIEERDGEHLYVCDPNGLILEFAVAEPPFESRPGAFDVVRDWIASTAPGR
jgi:catechol 2,3-dioxygenase-like lactoylglutathione lyase family enzyme